MSGVFDSLKGKLGENSEDGLSPILIAKLPPTERTIIRMLLRELEMGHAAIWDALQELPEGERPTLDQMEAALNNLANESWVIRMGEGDSRKYEPNMRRKPPSALGGAVWSQLGSRIAANKTPGEDKPE